MCVICLDLEAKFSQFRSKNSKQNNDLAKEYLKYLSLNPEQRCEFVRNFDYSLFNKTTDEDVVNGRHWAEVLKESFKDVKELQETIEASEKAMGSGVWVPPEIKPKESETKPICVHDWMTYYGAGTVRPEEICRKCGCQKSDHKASP